MIDRLEDRLAGKPFNSEKVFVEAGEGEVKEKF